MEEQKTGVFRQKSLERISSPEQLNDYLKVTNPGIWVIMAVVILLIGGLFAWSITGRLETVADGEAIVENGQAQIYVTDQTKGDIKAGMTLRFNEDEYKVINVETDSLGRTVAYAPVSEADGEYDVQIVTESIHPIQFLFS